MKAFDNIVPGAVGCAPGTARCTQCGPDRPQQILLALVPRLAHRSSPKPKTSVQRTTNQPNQKFQITRNPHLSPDFPAKPIAFTPPISSKNQQRSGFSRTTTQSFLLMSINRSIIVDFATITYS
jgi:hypothetical protein